MSDQKHMKRRQFLRNSTLGIAGASLAASSPTNLLAGEEKKKATEGIKIKQYRRLGRTGFMASDISSGGPQNVGVLNALLDAGVNYIDTAESYTNGESERITGKALKGRDRKKIFVTSKLAVRPKDTKETIIQRTLKSLERMDTPYVDCMMMHSPAKVTDLKNEHFHAAMEQLKKEGKVRFVGISNHGPQWRDEVDPMKDVMIAAAKDGRFDVVLFVYNFMIEEDGQAMIKALKAKDVGMTLMKVNPVGGYINMQAEMEKLKKENKPVPGYFPRILEKLKAKAEKAEFFTKKHNLKNPAEIRDAAIKYVLKPKDIATVTCSLTNFDQVDGFVKLSGCTPSGGEEKKLAMFKEGCGDLYCRHACGLCESKCPQQVPVNTIMRYNHYFEAQGREKHALQKYAAIPKNAANCGDCPGHCESACPFNVPVHGLLTLAHNRLTLT